MPRVTNDSIAYKAVKYAHMASAPSTTGKKILTKAANLATRARKGAGKNTKIVPAAMRYYKNLKNKNKHADAKKILGAAANRKISQ